jgi:hypothetical protein
MILTRDTEGLGEKSVAGVTVHYKSHVDYPGIELGPQCWKARDWLLKPRHDNNGTESQHELLFQMHSFIYIYIYINKKKERKKKEKNPV